jgi:hypothetical protein
MLQRCHLCPSLLWLFLQKFWGDFTSPITTPGCQFSVLLTALDGPSEQGEGSRHLLNFHQ